MLLRCLNQYARDEAWSLSSTTWTPCSNWLSVLPYFMKAANWRKALRMKSGRVRQSRKRISEGWTSMSLLEVNKINSYYGDSHILFRSEEQTSELQTLMRISYAVF